MIAHFQGAVTPSPEFSIPCLKTFIRVQISEDNTILGIYQTLVSIRSISSKFLPLFLIVAIQPFLNPPNNNVTWFNLQLINCLPYSSKGELGEHPSAEK